MPAGPRPLTQISSYLMIAAGAATAGVFAWKWLRGATIPTPLLIAMLVAGAAQAGLGAALLAAARRAVWSFALALQICLALVAILAAPAVARALHVAVAPVPVLVTLALVVLLAMEEHRYR